MDIKDFRKRLRLSQQQLATITGISVGWVSLIENGQKEPGTTLVQLFKVLDKFPETVEFLLED